ncbi:PaaX family transcriptional regulator C-terminal domain-containing protein [Microbacterium sp. P04]|uniref:PaaX family transcriptional regulator n=1 Tax=Microbacterium sp. P04 TaxID=3366947 RepID=UPI003744C9B8
MMGTALGGESIPVRRVSPARQVLTLFGDYWWRVPEALPTGSILGALGDLGVKEAAARAALGRLVDVDLLSAERDGRRTAHRLTDRGLAVVGDEAQWLDTFGVREQPWDGTWTVVAFSIPESQRALRHSSRSRLRWLGFAPLYDGVWISARDAAADALGQLSQLGVADVTAMRAQLERSGGASPRSAWNLDEIQRQYAAFATTLTDAETPGEPVNALALRSRLMLAWQAFRETDPALPSELLPSDWPRVPLRRRFAEVHASLGPASVERFTQLVSAIEPRLADRVTQRLLAA